MNDLIKQLHNVRLEGLQELCWKAADRIEEVVRERDYTDGTNDTLIALNQDLTAKLAECEAQLGKAVDALRFYSPEIIDGIEFGGGDDAGRTAAAVLAELERKE